MGNKRKNRGAKTLAVPATAASVSARPMALSGWGEIYEAAKRADFRGYFYFPTMNPKEQADVFTRQALMERTEWLCNNVGAVAMVMEGLALDEVGTGLWPKWSSGEAAYDRAMTDAFHYTNHDPRTFSADGQHDYYSAQYAIRWMIRRYGDCFGQLLRPSPGYLTPTLNLVPGWRVRNAGDEKPEEGWRDGIQTNRLGFPRAYKVMAEDGKSYEVVAAEDMQHFHDPFLPGQTRAVPALAAVAKRLYTREDLHRALMNGTLLREQLGFVIEKKEGPDAERPPVVLPGGEVTEITDAGGAKVVVQRFYGERERDGVKVPELPQGASLKVVESARSATGVTELLDSILRELGWSTKYPPEYVFFLAGMGQGTAVRLVLQKVQAVINSVRQFQLVPQFCNRWDVFFAWQMIAGGFAQREGVSVPKKFWWRRRVILPANISVDLGREGSLYDRRVATAKMSVEAYHGLMGEDASDVEDENLTAIARRLEKLKKLNEKNGTSFTYNDIWPRTENQPRQPAGGDGGEPPKKKTAAPGEEPGDDDAEEGKDEDEEEK